MNALGRCAIVVTSLVAAACDDSFDVSGTVSRCDEQRPLVGVRVTLVSGSKDSETFSDPEGSYALGLLVRDQETAQLRADKPSYRTYERELDREPEGTVDFCLEPDRVDGGSAPDAGVDGT
jgi:hypothetical protein